MAQTLGNWVNAYRAEHQEDEPPLTANERARHFLALRHVTPPIDIELDDRGRMMQKHDNEMIPRSRSRIATTAAAALLLLSGCAGDPDRVPSPTTEAAVDTGTTQQTPRITAGEAIEECAESLYYWYPSDDNFGGGFHWRYGGEATEVTSLDTEWRVVFFNRAEDSLYLDDVVDPDWEIVVEGDVQDGDADAWCETNADDTFNLGIVGGATRLDVSQEQLAAEMIERDRGKV